MHVHTFPKQYLVVLLSSVPLSFRHDLCGNFALDAGLLQLGCLFLEKHMPSVSSNET